VSDILFLIVYQSFFALEYTRLVHPAQCKVSNSILNNAIGNVFASDKRKLERKDIEKQLSNGTIDVSNADSD
jgi:hypothetical protein